MRDVRGALASLKQVDWAPIGIEEYFPRLWNYTNLHLFKTMQARENYLLVRYEDLVGNPRHVLSLATRFLGLAFEEQMLENAHRAPRCATIKATSTCRGRSCRNVPRHGDRN
ncbi:sulfotransferase domain-containing protein [Burkholderia glumae]|uniref:sulfotransferase domain-containing protein n=1 Tax=Burkholderia glumae TaxID=337 RepID=UPI0020B32690|nr:sulfotransferase domain-containing protein [Burkholderia glumae]